MCWPLSFAGQRSSSGLYTPTACGVELSTPQVPASANYFAFDSTKGSFCKPRRRKEHPAGREAVIRTWHQSFWGVWRGNPFAPAKTTRLYYIHYIRVVCSKTDGCNFRGAGGGGVNPLSPRSKRLGQLGLCVQCFECMKDDWDVRYLLAFALCPATFVVTVSYIPDRLFHCGGELSRRCRCVCEELCNRFVE